MAKGKKKISEAKIKLVVSEPERPVSGILKPAPFDLNKFKAEPPESVANVTTLLTALPHHPISQAKDFVRLHPDENLYWSSELVFVNVPIKGMKRAPFI
jgi:hypothetical protein